MFELNKLLDIRTSASLVSRFQYRFPRSKRARIRKKWAGNKRNFKTVPSEKVLVLDFPNRPSMIIVHPAKYAELLAVQKSEMEKWAKKWS